MLSPLSVVLSRCLVPHSSPARKASPLHTCGGMKWPHVVFSSLVTSAKAKVMWSGWFICHSLCMCRITANVISWFHWNAIIIIIIIIYLSKTSKHINRANRFKNTYSIGLDAKVHVGLFNRLHVAHKDNTKIEMIYNQITPKYTHTKGKGKGKCICIARFL